MRKEIVSLTSLRGLAAMAVIALHFSATMQTLASGNFPSLAPHGELAVDVFFVLSGFIMAYTYLPSFEDGGGWGAYKNFLGKRFARIMPLNLAMATLLTLGALLSIGLAGVNHFPKTRPDHLFSDWALNAMMLPGIGIGNSINWPAWSISVEFVAYLFFPIFLFGIFHARRTVFVAYCLIATLGVVLVCVTGGNLSPGGIHNNDFLPWRDLGRCFSEFVLGLATFRLYRSGRWAAFFRRDAVVAVIVACILGIILFRLGDLFAILFFPPLILALSLNDRLAARFMAMRFPYFLGVISYSLYLVHDNFRPLVVELVRHFHPEPLAPALAMFLAACFTLMMIFPAWACYAWVERPGRSLFRSLFASASRGNPLGWSKAKS